MSDRLTKEIQDELNFIGRYMGSISPSLSRYKELDERKKKLRKQLKEISSVQNKNTKLEKVSLSNSS